MTSVFQYTEFGKQNINDGVCKKCLPSLFVFLNSAHPNDILSMS